MKSALVTLTFTCIIATSAVSRAEAAAEAPRINAPTAGQVYSLSDGDVLFNVDGSVGKQAHPNAGCCEVEFQYKNKAGAWTPNDPVVVEYSKMVFGDYSRSTKEFAASTDWRLRARLYEYNKSHTWSDWVEFNVGVSQFK